MSKVKNHSSPTPVQTAQAFPTTGVSTPLETLGKISASGVVKCNRNPMQMFLLAMLSGFYLGVACIATTSVTFSVENVGMARLLTALLFPFGLMMIISTGSELYTGNNLIIISYLEKKVTLAQMIKSWVLVYSGNFVGCAGLAFLYAQTKNIHLGSGLWAESVLSIATGKVSFSMVDGILLGIICNILVTVAVFMANSSSDFVGRMISALVPISLFVMAGTEHCVANMFYVPMGILLVDSPYGTGDHSILSFGSFLLCNLLPVTLGNTLGGVLFGSTLWFANRPESKK